MKKIDTKIITKAEKIIREKKIKEFSMRFCDLDGRWAHFTVPVSRFYDGKKLSASFITDGVAFDGSSLEGFKGVEQSDLLAIPDLRTVTIDPLAVKPTLILVCNLAEPETRNPYIYDPRSVAVRAEEYLSQTGIADTAYFGPELEFFIFDSVSWKVTENSSYYKIISKEGGMEDEPDGISPRIRFQEGYFKLPPYDHFSDIRDEIMDKLSACGVSIERDTHERATAGSAEIDLTYDSLIRMADKTLLLKYLVKRIVTKYGQISTFMPKPLYGHNGNGMHTHHSLWKNGKPLFYDRRSRYHKLSQFALYYIGGLLTHAKALCVLVAPSVVSYRRLVPGYEAPTAIGFGYRNRSTLIRIPAHPNTPESRRIEFRSPDPTANIYLCFSAMLMAGMDGVMRRIDPYKIGFGLSEKSDYDVLPSSKNSCYFYLDHWIMLWMNWQKTTIFYSKGRCLRLIF